MTQRASASRAAAPGRGRAAGAFFLRATGASLKWAVRRPVVLLAGVAIAGGAGVFAWNATMTQTARHPAPLFAAPKPVAAKAEAKPEPQRRAEPAGPLTTGATRADAPTPPPRPAGGPDAIGSIIRSAEAPAKQADAKPKPAETKKVADAKPAPPAEPRKAAEAKPAAAKTAEAKTAEAKSPDAKRVDAKGTDGKQAEAKAAAEPRVASAQKALAKLGYGPLTADGLIGAATRQALEKFERDKKLPVTGSLGPRTAKQLASLSGIAVQ